MWARWTLLDLDPKLARMPDYSLNWTARSSAIQEGTRVSMMLLAPPESGPTEAKGLTVSSLPWRIDMSSTDEQSAKMPDICFCLPLYSTWHKVNDLKVNCRLGEGKMGYQLKLEPCLVQSGPDKPSWSWTKIWVQARMPDYSISWTARSNAIQMRPRCLCCSSPNHLVQCGPSCFLDPNLGPGIDAVLQLKLDSKDLCYI